MGRRHGGAATRRLAAGRRTEPHLGHAARQAQEEVCSATRVRCERRAGDSNGGGSTSRGRERTQRLGRIRVGTGCFCGCTHAQAQSRPSAAEAPPAGSAPRPAPRGRGGASAAGNTPGSAALGAASGGRGARDRVLRARAATQQPRRCAAGGRLAHGRAERQRASSSAGISSL